MSDANIPALLEELWEVDFETWKDIRFLLLNSMMFSEPREIPLEQHIYHDIIQGCIQRAIAAHPDWIMFQWRRAGKWRTSIRRGLSGYSDPEYMHIVENDTPAAAILAAYIEAKRAMR
jgi:hypothetical protein